MPLIFSTYALLGSPSQANLLSFLDGDFFIYEFFLVNIYYFLFLNTATLFFQSPRMSISACDTNYASHDKVLLNGGTG